MSAVIKEGYLLKYINFLQGWKKRYFILSGHELVYKDKQEDMKAKRIINIMSSDIEMSIKEDTEFLIKIDKITVTLKASNVIEKVKWVDSLRLAKGGITPKRHIDYEAKSDEKIKAELLEAIQTMYIKEHDSITKAMCKIWSNQVQIEDLLGQLVPMMHQLNEPKVENLTNLLDQHFSNLKTSIQEGVTAVESYNECLKNQVKKDNGLEQPKNEEQKEDEESKEFKEEFFDAIEKEEIKSESNRSEDAVQEQRNVLPAQRVTFKGVGIWDVLKEVIGKDLSHFSVPVYFNEPLSMLQKIAECMEYERLLRMASKETNSLKRTMYVSSFLCAQYYNTEKRTKKPFNPILGETYEFADKEFKFFSEQVCHHPPISALHVESNSYEMWMHSHVKLSFWGKSLEAIPLGSMYIYLKTTGELFTMNRPTSGAYNLILGKMYVDTFGESICVNHKTGEKVDILYHRKGWTESSYGLVTGKALDAAGKEVYAIKGKWTDSISAEGMGEAFLLWKGNERSSDWEKYYYFSHFSMQLNYLSDSLAKVLPKSDTRFRPDQKALENGNLKLASSEKLRLEEKQRKARKLMESQKITYSPLYFEKAYHEVTHENYYKFNPIYWKNRETSNWKNTPDLF